MSRTKLLLALVSLALTLAGCTGEPDPNVKPVIASPGESRDVLKEAERLSASKLEAFENDADLSDQDKKDLKRAAILFDALSDYQPTNVAPYVGAGKCYLAIGDPEAAVQRLKQGIAQVPPKLDIKDLVNRAVVDTQIEGYYTLSKACSRLKQNNEALDAINHAISIFPQSPIYLVQRASVEMDMRDDDAAKADLEAALKIDPETRKAVSLIKLMLLRQSDDWSDKAHAANAKHDYKGAIAAANKGLEIAPDYVKLFTARAEAYLALGDKAKALDDLDMAISLKPADPEVVALKKKLKR